MTIKRAKKLYKLFVYFLNGTHKMSPMAQTTFVFPSIRIFVYLPNRTHKLSPIAQTTFAFPSIRIFVYLPNMMIDE